MPERVPEEWSQWLDFDRTNVESVPEAAGVFVMHAAMKVLYIGSGQSVRAALADRLNDECCSKAKRFRYMLAPAAEDAKDNLLRDYREKHGGMLPACNSSESNIS